MTCLDCKGYKFCIYSRQILDPLSGGIICEDFEEALNGREFLFSKCFYCKKEGIKKDCQTSDCCGDTYECWSPNKFQLIEQAQDLGITVRDLLALIELGEE